MFSQVAIFTVATLAVFAAAKPSESGGINDSCNTGPVQCCMLLFTANFKMLIETRQLLPGRQLPRRTEESQPSRG